MKRVLSHQRIRLTKRLRTLERKKARRRRTKQEKRQRMLDWGREEIEGRKRRRAGGHHSAYARRSEKGTRLLCEAPTCLSLTENYEGTVDFFHWLQGEGARDGKNIMLDFSHLKRLGPCGALMLAAEIDRWRRVQKFKPRYEKSLWEPSIPRLLTEMGLFNILEVTNPPEIKSPINPDMRFYLFRSGARAKGASKAPELRMDIEAGASAPVPNPNRLFASISEAMTNRPVAKVSF